MYDHKKVEEETLKLWEDNKIFDKLREKNAGKEKFRFIDGPITANYSMGVHHAYSRAIKDLYQRYKALQGYDQRYQNGFDCHGLPVEVNVEKEEKMDIKRDIENYGFEKFIGKCRARVEKYSKIMIDESIRMGQWMDWGNDYYTMSDENMAHIWHFLKKCNDNDWLYRGFKVLPWCWRCGTSLSQHEQTDSHRETEHTSVYLRFKLKGKKDEYLLVWTTTPWTLTSNVACAVNPDIAYVKAKKDDKIYYLSKATAEKSLGEYEELGAISGSQMIGLEYEGPYDYLEAQKGVVHKVVDWNMVGEVDGTGIVHIAPGCGAEDNELGKELDLAVIAPIDEQGVYYSGFGEFTGKHVTKVLEPIVEDLEKRGVLFKKELVKHRYPFCWRCGEDLVFRATKEWFIKMDDIKPKMIEESEKVKWSPSYGNKMMASWLNTMSDWNISRKRYWGIPLPFWVCENEKCGELEVIGSLEELKEKATEGMEGLKDIHRPWIDRVKLKCEKCGSTMSRTPEVGDCWLDAGIVPYSTLHYLTDNSYWREWFPAELIAEMREQIRLWFYSMLCMSVVLEGRAPYEKVILFEEVRDEKSQTMHKSGKNVILLNEAFEKVGADSLRWTYLTTKFDQKVLFGYKLGEEAKQKLTYLINISTYMSKFMKNPPKPPVLKNPEDAWFISKMEKTNKLVTQNMDELCSHESAKLIEEFMIENFSKQYIKYIRNKTDDENTANIIYYSLLKTLQMISPFTPFIAEQLYQKHFRKYEKTESIHLLDWPKADETLINETLETEMDAVRSVIESALAARNAAGINVRQPLASLTINADCLERWHSLIAEQVNVKQIKLGKNIELDTKLTAELEKEGLTREVIRRVQQMRKEMNLVETDVIALVITPKLDINYDELKKTANVADMPASLDGQSTSVVIKGKNVTITAKKL